MIKLNVKDYCQNCWDFEPECIKLSADIYREMCTTDVYCEHRNRCANIYDVVRKKFETKK